MKIRNIIERLMEVLRAPPTPRPALLPPPPIGGRAQLSRPGREYSGNRQRAEPFVLRPSRRCDADDSGVDFERITVRRLSWEAGAADDGVPTIEQLPGIGRHARDTLC